MAEDRVERRLTTILAADVVGYSRLMAADEAGTLTSLKALRRELIEPKTAEYHGRVVKLIGDGTLMEFASVVDAVTFAVEMQRAMAERNAGVPEDRRITYRVGINIGDIIVEDDDIYGHGVNVAARLEQLADSGGICIVRNVFNQVKNKLDISFRDMGEQELKNSRTSPIQSGPIGSSWETKRSGRLLSTRMNLCLFPTSPPSRYCPSTTCRAIPSRNTSGTGWPRTSSRRSQKFRACS